MHSFILLFANLKKEIAKIQLLFNFQSPFLPLQVLKRIFLLSKSSTGEKDAKKTVKMLRKSTRRKARKKGRKNTEPGKEKRNYNPN